MNTPSFSIHEARQQDTVDYLQQLGYTPHKIRGNDYWYLSPLRNERTPSFKVNRQLNVWYDHGIGRGGNLIDFGVLYFNCSVKDFLNPLRPNQQKFSSSFHPHFSTKNNSFSPLNSAGEKKEDAAGKITVIDVRELEEKKLLEYLESRRIPAHVARQFCKEVDISLYGKVRTLIGFENNAAGYELRGPDFKASSSPKTSTFFDHSKKIVSVFEGFFDYLSYQTLHKEKPPLTNFLVLNSLAFFEKEKIRMEGYSQVHLYLDRDPAGVKSTKEALKRSIKFIDKSHAYRNCKDLNEWLVKKEKLKYKEGHGLRRHL